METSSKFNEQYFMDSKFSNYKNYDERPYEQLVKDLVKVLNLNRGDKIFDFGCATGKLVQYFYDKGFKNVSGFDISEWAIKHGKQIYPEIAGKICNYEMANEPKAIICLDVLEHLETNELYKVLNKLRNLKSKYLVVRIPVCSKMGEDYVLDCSNKDSTHVQKMTKQIWYQLLKSFDFKLMGTINETDIYDSHGVLCAVFENQTCDEIYFRGRDQMEAKHYQDAIDWKEFFKCKTAVLFGCGVGQRVYALRKLGVKASGLEISKFAVRHRLSNYVIPGDVVVDTTFNENMEKVYDISIAYDLLEHIQYENLDKTINNIINHSNEYILISIPFKGNPDLDADPTHIIKEDRDWWVQKFLDKGLKEVEVPEHFLYKEQLLIFEK